MKIAYLSCVYPPYPGGIGVLAQGMASEMAARGYEVEVFTPKFRNLKLETRNSESKFPISNFQFQIHRPRPLVQFGNAALLPQLLWRLKGFDVVHILYPFFGIAEMIPYLRLRVKVKVIVHHTMDAVAEGALGLVFRLYNQTLMPRIFKHAHQIITLSEDYFRDCDLTAVYEAMPDAPSLEFVPNGVDVDIFRPASRNLKLETRNLESQFPVSSFQFPTIVFASGLDRAHYFKGVHVLLEAMRILKARSVKCRCWIIGDGKMRKEYEAHAREAGVLCKKSNGQMSDVKCQMSDAHVQFLGLVPHEKMPEYYRQATVAVVPSTARVECFSIVAAEAQSCGIPAIVSDFPGVRVTVENGKTGYVVRPGDPEELANRIQELVEDPQKARQMGAAGRKRAVEFYSWKKIGEKLEEIYCHVTRNT